MHRASSAAKCRLPDAKRHTSAKRVSGDLSGERHTHYEQTNHHPVRRCGACVRHLLLDSEQHDYDYVLQRKNDESRSEREPLGNDRHRPHQHFN